MKTVRIFLVGLCMFAALAFTACDNASNTNEKDEMYKEGEPGDTANNMNNSGNYSPDVRTDNRGGERPQDSTYLNTGSKFDAQGNPVTGNDDVHSNRQQDATTGKNSNTEQQKSGE